MSRKFMQILLSVSPDGGDEDGDDEEEDEKENE